MAEKKIFSDTLLETTATEESPDAIWQGQILRRPKNQCQLTDGMVGLLRMTSSENLGIEAGNRALIQARFLMKGIRR